MEVSDDIMRYFQFKARQLYLLKKEEEEWKNYCEQNGACLDKKPEVQACRDVGIQVNQRNMTFGGRSHGTKIQANTLPKTCATTHSHSTVHSSSNIKDPNDQEDGNIPSCAEVRLGQLDQDMKRKAQVVHHRCVRDDYSLSEERRRFIQNSLRTSLRRLERSRSIPPKRFNVKPEGFFLPWKLKQDRAVARRTYLASLHNVQTKKPLKKNLASNLDSPHLSKATNSKVTFASNGDYLQKPGENISKEITKESEDKNTEQAIDGIMDDLLGETVSVLAKIEQVKGKVTSGRLKQIFKTVQDIESERDAICKKWNLLDARCKEPSSTVVNISKFTIDEESSKIGINVRTKANQNDISHFHKEGCIGDSLSKTNVTANFSKTKGEEISSDEINPKPATMKNSDGEDCVYKEIFVQQKKIENIFKYKRDFWRYLQRISHIEKGDFNPWITVNKIAEDLIDDCLKDISKEMCDIPPCLVTELYDQEFVVSA